MNPGELQVPWYGRLDELKQLSQDRRKLVHICSALDKLT